MALPTWGGLEDKSQVSQDERYYCRLRLSHRAAIGRVTWADPQNHVEVYVPFGGGSDKKKAAAFAQAKALLTGIIISLELHK